ncbi:MAG: hypothetical protein ACXABY_34570 [Candidatus Thorarchaeota archaeon]
MAIRIECELGGFEKNWIEFRDSPWPFGDRRAMMEGQSDLISLEVILGYVTDWEMRTAKGKLIDFDPKADLDILDAMDEILVNWIIGAWFEARQEREDLSKKVSENSETS